jgi:hypothetical protein
LLNSYFTGKISLMPTLILSPRHTEDSQRLWRAAGKRGWDVERLTSWRATEQLRNIADPVIYVEVLMAPTVATELGIELLEAPENWLPQLPYEYRKRDIALTTLGEARTCENPRFVKPPNDKSFPAGIVLGRDLPRDFPDESPVLVSEIVEWNTEFRCFVLDRKVVTFSVYLRDGELQKESGYATDDAEDEAVTAFTQKVLNDPRVSFPRAFVMDVGVIRERGWAVVELNAAWGSGLYGCDEDKVLDVLLVAAGR